jgi:putative nucleotidyltransferase with HDIG domain
VSRKPSVGAGRRLLQRLSGDPGGERGERIRYHGARAILIVALASLVTFSFPPTERTDVQPSYSLEDVAQEDVVAQIPFAVEKSAAELERERRLAAEAIPPTFVYRPEASDTVAARLRRFFDRLDSAAAAGDTLQIGAILQESRIDAGPEQTGYVLDDGSRPSLRRAAEGAVLEMLPRGIADPTPLSGLTTNVITVRRDGDETNVPVSDVSTSQDFYEQAVSALPSDLPPDAQQLLRLMLIAHLEHSLVYDVQATEEDRAAARASVNTTKADVLEGEAIVRAAERIGPETLERLEAYQQALRAAGLFEPEEPMLAAVIGSGLVNVLLLSIFGLLLRFSRPSIYANFRWLLLITLLAATYFGAAVAIDRAQLPAEWLPIAFVALPVAVLWDTRIALLLALMLAAITGTLPPFSSYGTVLVVMVGGATAAMSVRAVRRRSETWVSIAIISGAASLVYVAYGMSTGQPVVEFARASLVITGNATVSALLAVGFLWVFELFTGITTDQTLLEWADPTRPLLRRLSMEAPGTYAHTINVANLAEAAATEIGANGLLCRVGVLYHDVGKMLKPYYFVENQPDGRNPHDKLKPETSAAIVREHVTEGVRLAKEANVPDVVTAFILEHHGTQRIGFFYEKAREESDEELDPSRFSYPGPRPQSKETAIVMLADSCESAARAMHEPTHDRIVDLIDTVVDGKVADHQLDEAPLTLGELARIKHQFVTILSGVKHRRIEYPETKHLTDAENGPDTAASDKLEAGDEVA